MNDLELMKMALNSVEIGLDAVKNEQYENAQRYERYKHLASEDQEYVNQLEITIKALRGRIAELELKEMIVKGTKAWKDVDSTQWVEDLRGEK